MSKIIKIVVVLVVLFLLVASFLAWRWYFRFLFITQQQRITISLPFSKEDDDLIFINPMGETDHHDPPRGHPGLDFAWKRPVPLRAAASGRVTSIEEHPPGGFGETEKIYDVEVVSGIYAIRYEEIAPLPSLKVGAYVNIGEVIGRGGEYKQPGDGGVMRTNYSTHWEFDYDAVWVDRLCPLTYFDKESLDRINTIWSKVGQTYNGQFPEICNGFYKGRDKL